MVTLGQRVKTLRKDRKLTQSQVGKALGVSDVTIGYWERDLNEPGGKSLTNLARYFGVSEEYLLYGKNEESNVMPASLGTTSIPIISFVQAVAWSAESDARSLEGNVDYILTDQKLSPSSFALRLKGRSMEPEFTEGDIIIVDPEIGPIPGDYVVAKNGSHEATFKKYRSRGIDATGDEIFELVPLNPDFPTKSSQTESISIIGVMVEHRRFRRR
ncbi:LexA family protein [Sodalis sp. RH21]|uniref:LexA family protein n=1 Tax=unclassified Sodalis (in: enterobacteria) TaxID=2636512 RepID=UPI0039B54A82